MKTANCDYLCYGFMKKIFTFILGAFYLLLTSGVIINHHYCMNRLNATEFFAAKNDTCNKCGMQTSDANKCCHDEITMIRLHDDHVASYHSFQLKQILPVVTFTPGVLFASLTNANQESSFIDTSPPIIKGQDTYLQNCVFRI
jgi:predicted nucleic acid binding AN1-type Zn finger protein